MKWFDALAKGLWLGMLSRADLHRIDQSYYDLDGRYGALDYVSRGFFDWERAALEARVVPDQRWIVLGAGAGREVWALNQARTEVRGFECHASLRQRGNEILSELGARDRILPMARDLCPTCSGTHDGAIVGWGAYMLIAGRTTRVAFLTGLRRQLLPGSPVLLSFFARSGEALRFRTAHSVATITRVIMRMPPTELGDFLSPNFVHFFTPAEIESELSAAGFDIALYSEDGYPHAIGVSRR